MGNLSGLVAILHHRPKLPILHPHRQRIAAAHLHHAAHQLAGLRDPPGPLILPGINPRIYPSIDDTLPGQVL
jgi:hypothetical protein